MHRAIRPLVVFGVTSGITLAAFQLIGGAHGGSAGPSFKAPLAFAISGYDLAQLELLEPTLYHVEENYVEPERVDYEMMYVEALEAVERFVPVCMFRREPGGKTLSIEIGEYRTILEVEPVSSRRQLQDELERVASAIKEHLDPEEVPYALDGEDPLAEVEYALVNGVLGTLDPHSVLLPPEASKEMDVENTGEFGGLGITIIDRDGKLTIEYPLPDTPAMAAGLQPDDHIVRIDGESTINMSLEEAVSRLRGKVGAPVNIEIARLGLNKPLKVRIVRETIRIN
ncbi:MAG: PDZ domain-containing protein, partial [Proteobacteria bacterium]|nr:PDZ domain-containing protein [Pseudomonadota bacterium]